MLVSDDLTMTLCWNHLATVERAEGLPGNPWDGEWFEEDYCEGPGQALIVNPKGEVKPCCGFASDLDQLTIGNIHTDTRRRDHRARAEAPVRRQDLPRGAVGDPRRDPRPRPERLARRDEQSLLLLLVRADARPGGRRERRRRQGRGMDGRETELCGRAHRARHLAIDRRKNSAVARLSESSYEGWLVPFPNAL